MPPACGLSANPAALALPACALRAGPALLGRQGQLRLRERHVPSRRLGTAARSQMEPVGPPPPPPGLGSSCSGQTVTGHHRLTARGQGPAGAKTSKMRTPSSQPLSGGHGQESGPARHGAWGEGTTHGHRQGTGGKAGFQRTFHPSSGRCVEECSRLMEQPGRRLRGQREQGGLGN